MNHFVYLLLYAFLSEVFADCPQEPYLNLCALNENDQDSTYNIRAIEEICDCQQAIYCSVLEISPVCNSTEIKLNNIDSDINNLECELLSLDSQVDSLDIELVNITGGGIGAQILTDLDSGRYLLICSLIETYDEETNPPEWEVESIHPTEVTVGSDVELELTVVSKNGNNSTYVWCVIKTPDEDTEILSATWISKSQVKCSQFKVSISGLFTLGLTSNGLNKIYDQKLRVIPKRPNPEQAEYDFDLKTIYIHFDENINLNSTCTSVFTEETQKNFGIGFTCSTRGNIFMIKMGLDSKLLNTIEIISGNQICSVGAPGTEYCALPTKFPVFEKRVSGPSLNLFMNTPCDRNTTEKYLSVKVENPKMVESYSSSKMENNGKKHRRNLIAWRNIRQFQSRLSSRLVSVQINSTDVLPVIENIASFGNFLEGDNTSKISARVSVVVQSPPISSTLVAEANVTFCNNSMRFYHYKWTVNTEVVAGDGKLLTVENLSPGKYLIGCFVIDHESSEILGQGWAIMELVDWPEKVIIFPAEIAVGITDDILLRAVTWHGKSISWTCRTFLDKPCVATGADRRLVNEILDLKSPVVSIPAGTLSVGNYIWSVENVKEQNPAKVYIKPGNVPAIDVQFSSVFVSASQEVALNATISRLQRGCLAWWSSVREKGYDYLKIQNMDAHEVRSPTVIPLIIPQSFENSNSLKADSYYMFKLQVVCPNFGSSAHVKVPVNVNNPPSLSSLIVEPKTGEALITNFSWSRIDAEGSTENQPLLYEWSYIDPCGVEVLINRGALPRQIITFLPPGDLKLIVRVCDLRGTCSASSSSVITVTRSASVPPENFRFVRNQIQSLMTRGDTLEAFGLITTVFKSLPFVADTKTREEIYSTVENSVKIRIEHLKKEMGSVSKADRLLVEFLKQAVDIARYFRKGSGFMEYLENALEGTASRRVKRNGNSVENNSTVGIEMRNVFKLHSATLLKNDTIQNRMELLKDVRKWMLKICSDSLINSILIDSQIVDISIRKIIPEKDTNKWFSFPGDRNFNLELAGKFLKPKTCLSIARFTRDLLGNTKDSRLTQMYEVQIIKNGRFIKAAKNDATILTLTFPVSNPPKSGIDCMMWTKNRGWSLKCVFKGTTIDGIVCSCKDFGYYSAFLRNPIVKPTGGLSVSSSNSSTNDWRSYGLIEISEWDSCISFKIKEDFNATVGNDSNAFRDSLKRQLAHQLKIPPETISYLFIKPGSIHVTVFFINIQDTKAESVVKDLVSLLHNGNLQLISPNNTRLTIDQNDLKVMVSPSTNEGNKKIRFVAYAVLTGTLLIISVTFSVIVVVRKRGRRIPVRISNLSQDDPPVYRRFCDESSIDGTSASLAVYRRNALHAESCE